MRQRFSCRGHPDRPGLRRANRIKRRSSREDSRPFGRISNYPPTHRAATRAGIQPVVDLAYGRARAVCLDRPWALGAERAQRRPCAARRRPCPAGRAGGGRGFLYPRGYFRQRIAGEGQRAALYEKLRFAEMPAVPATGPDGREVMISVDLPGRKVYAKVWRIQVGRIALYLMDTDVEPNAPADRTLSARLYGGDHEMRIAQEIMLGIGGVRAIRALGLDPLVWHM